MLDFLLVLAILVDGGLFIDYLNVVSENNRITHYDLFILVALLLMFTGLSALLIC